MISQVSATPPRAASRSSATSAARLRGTIGVLQLVVAGWCLAAAGAVDAAETRCAVMEVFLRGNAENSQAAREFIERTYGGKVLINWRDVEANQEHLDRYWKLVDHFKVAKPGLPAFYVAGVLEVGWDAAVTPQRLKEALTIEILHREGCPRCHAARTLIRKQLLPIYPGFEYVEREITTSPENAQRLQELARRHGVQATSVPGVHLAGRLFIGYFDDTSSFRQWDTALRNVTSPCPAAKRATDPPAGTPQSFRSPRRPLHENGRKVRVSMAGRSPVMLNSGFGALMMASLAQAEPPAVEPPAAQPPSAEPPAVEVPAADPPPAAAPPSAELPRAEPAADTALPLPPETSPSPASEAVAPGLDAPPPRRELPPEVAPQEREVLSEGSSNDYESVTLPLLGEVRWREWGLPAFTIGVGLIDGFNPCAMWVLLFLLSVLVNLQDRWKILAVAGTFVLVSGLAYFAFMAAWLNVFQLVGLMRPAQVALGVLGIIVGAIHIKDFFAFRKGVSLSIPDAAKPGLYARMRGIVMAESLFSAIAGATVLAVLVNIIELLCTAGLPAMYTSILTMQKLPTWQNYLYLALYIAAYMFDDAMMVAIVVTTLGRHKLQEQGGRVLKLLSGLVIVALGVVMLVQPDLLH